MVVLLRCESEQWNGCATSSFETSTRLMGRFPWAMSESLLVSISRRVYVRSLCYDYQFSFILKLELITITKIWHLDSLWKRDWGELRRGLLYWPLASSACSYENFRSFACRLNWDNWYWSWKRVNFHRRKIAKLTFGAVHMSPEWASFRGFHLGTKLVLSLRDTEIKCHSRTKISFKLKTDPRMNWFRKN